MLKQLFELLTFGTLVLLVATQNEPDSNICTSERCLKTAMMFSKHMDPITLSCNNFYDFMCRNFPKTNPLMPGHGRESAFTIREQYVNEKLLELLNSEQHGSSAVQKARTHYQNCMDEATIEELGSSAVILELNAIGLPIKPPFNQALIESYDLSRLLARSHRQASYAKFLFEVTVTVDTHDIRKNYVCFDNTSAAYDFWNNEQTNELEVFAIRSHVASEEEEIKKEKEREFMEEVVQYMCALTGVRFSEKVIQNITKNAVDFLAKLREIKKLEKEIQSEPTKFTLVELQAKTDEILGGNQSQIKINWLDYLETLFENIRDNIKQIFERGEPILITNMKQFEAVLKLVATVNQKVLVSAMWWTAIHSVSAFASKELRRIYYDFEIQVQKTQIPPRQKRCLSVVKNQFPFILGAVLFFADENASEDQNKVAEMLDNIKNAFQDTITNSQWLDVSTKMATLNKLRRIRQMISFDNWMLMSSEIESVYSDKTVIPGQYFTTLRLINRASRDQNLSYLSVDNDPLTGLPPGNPGEVNAYYMSQFNGISLPIGILGPPFYGLGLEALNYGAIGVVIGHELGHAFDSSGKNFDSWGSKREWWKKSTNTEYAERTDCFVKSYDDIFIPKAGRKVNGKLTLNENIADYLGFTQALKAYRQYVAKHGQEKRLPHFEHYSHDRLFTMAFANLYCEVATPGYAKWQLENDEHSPGLARILGVLRNSVEFAEIWGCRDGSRMNPKEKCKLW